MRVKREYRTASKANYNRFKSLHPKMDVSFEDYKKILKHCNRMFYMEALNSGDRVKLPYGFGEFAVHKYIPKLKTTSPSGVEYINLPIDFKRTKEEGVKVYNMNFHSSGYRFKWKLFPNTVRLNQSIVWVMKPTRAMSRELAKYIFSDPYYSQLYQTW